VKLCGDYWHSTGTISRSRVLRAALLVVDLQNDFLAKGGYYDRGKTASAIRSSGPFEPRDGDKLPPIRPVIDRIRRLIKKARSKKLPIAYIAADYGHAYAIRNRSLQKDPNKEVACRPSTWGSCLIDPICALLYRKPNIGDEIVIRKHTYDGFFQTELLEFLRMRKIGVVLIAGAETHVCVLRTAETAVLNQFRTVILEDCVWSHDEQLAKCALEIFEDAYGTIARESEPKRRRMEPKRPLMKKVAKKLGFDW
jgi:nicotinamidase-related amidase